LCILHPSTYPPTNHQSSRARCTYSGPTLLPFLTLPALLLLLPTHTPSTYHLPTHSFNHSHARPLSSHSVCSHASLPPPSTHTLDTLLRELYSELPSRVSDRTNFKSLGIFFCQCFLQGLSNHGYVFSILDLPSHIPCFSLYLGPLPTCATSPKALIQPPIPLYRYLTSLSCCLSAPWLAGYIHSVHVPGQLHLSLGNSHTALTQHLHPSSS
jgi:hypothetical protein